MRVCGQNIIWHGVGNLFLSDIILLVIFHWMNQWFSEVLQGLLNSCSLSNREFFWSDFTPGWQILEASPKWKHIRSSSRAFLAKRAAGFSLSLLPNNIDRMLSSISSGNKYSLISPQTHDAFFHFLCPLHKMEKWRWEAVVAPSLKKKYVQDHHSSFWELLAHLRH